MKNKGFLAWIGIAVFALLAGLFIANYDKISGGWGNIKDDINTQVEEVLPDNNENTENEENTETPEA